MSTAMSTLSWSAADPVRVSKGKRKFTRYSPTVPGRPVALSTSAGLPFSLTSTSDVTTAALQDQASRWMVEQRQNYAVVTSQLVVAEATAGDSDAAARRLAMLADIPILAENPDVDRVADELLLRSLIPRNARVDALHVAIAALAGVQYLLTLNCRHIANASVLPRVYRLLDELGLSGILICTPMEFLGGSSDAKQPNT